MATTQRKGKAQKGTVNKSEEIRKYLAEHKKATPTEVRDALKLKGIIVTTGLVSQVKSVMRKKRRRPSTKRATKPTVAAPRFTVDELMFAKSFAQKVGGPAKAQELLGALAKLQ